MLAAQKCRHLPAFARRRGLATLTEPPNQPDALESNSTFQTGQTYHGFKLERIKDVPELQLKAFHLQHDKTGAEYLHVARDDTNNVFSVGFKTNPPDDTGIPHILEHTTLCGSEKYTASNTLLEHELIFHRYPIRDPFFKMLPRTLSNFMNAFTSSDHTSYPFATTNEKDFKNLMSVYLDATLHPLLKEEDFTQEGWRIGPENPSAVVTTSTKGDKQTSLVFKGVVYNEMKGQMSDASYLYYIKFQEHIFPDIHNSGGDPQKMTDLTYTDLKDFHARNYHPSNAKFFTYGSMPLQDHLEEISKQLDHFSKMNADKAIKVPISLKDGPVEYTIEGPTDPLVDKNMQYKTSTSWLMGDTSDVVESFALRVLSSLLLDGYGSPLYKGLIEAGLGPDWSPNTGYDNAGKIGIFSVGMNGVKEADVLTVKETTKNTLSEIHGQGFDQSKIDGILHQLELSLKHKTANFGMGLMQRLQPGWFNGVDPFDALAWNDIVSAFKKNLSQAGYLESLLEKYLLNDQCLTFTMKPSETYGNELSTEEARRLVTKIKEASEAAGGMQEAHTQLTARELELLKAQETARNQDLSCLPTVHVKDIPREQQEKAIRDSSLGDVKVQWREASTNGLTYLRAIHTFQGLPSELRPLIPLFTDAIMRLGTKNKTMEELEDLIKLKTGGINLSYSTSTSPNDLHLATEGLSFSAYALDSNVPAMYELLRVLLQETNFDGVEAEKKVRQLLQSDASGALDAVASSGHSYARRYAEVGLRHQAFLTEETGGLTQIQRTAILAGRSLSEGLGDIISKLKSIQEFAITNSSQLRTALTCGQESVSGNEVALQKFLSSLPTLESVSSPGLAELPPYQEYDNFRKQLYSFKPQSSFQSYGFRTKTFFDLPYQVYYSALAFPTACYSSPESASLQVLAQLLTHKYLHGEIREKGGAYGGGAYARSLSGIFGFYSYRDPNPQNTIKVMQQTGRWAFAHEWTTQDLREAKLSVFQGIDAPESVSEEGMMRFVNGIDHQMEQRRRAHLLATSTSHIKAAIYKHLLSGAGLANLAVLGEKKDWINEADGWDVKKLEMVQPVGLGEGSDQGGNEGAGE